MEQGLAMREPRSVVVIDSLPLRRAEIAAFLADWARGIGADVREAASMRQEPDLADAGVVIVNLGSQSIRNGDMRGSLADLVARKSGVPLVLLSDREEADEIVAAYQLGAAGFLPTSLEPRVALHALTFIVNGGSFFPPAALLERPARGRNDHGTTPTNDATRTLQKEHSCAEPPVAGLSARQMEVYRLLCRGVRNKEIAALLEMREATVKVHVRQIIRKLGVANRTQAALTTVRLRAVSQDAQPRAGRA